MAALSSEVTGGRGVYLASATDVDLAAAGYEQHEYFATGNASSYMPKGELTPDGLWSFVPAGSADYKTRVLVRRPTDPKRFSGTVVVEWLNVSGGVDTDAEFVSTREELLRSGDVWVGVSAQMIGVEGGPVLVKVTGVPGAEDAGKGLKAVDPERYGSLNHPGDGFSFDIYTQVARAIRAGAGLSGLQPRRLIAAGQSQSAFAMVTYYNGVQPLTDAFDGFYVHSRGAGELPLVGPGKPADFAGAIASVKTVLRSDLPAPVLDLQTETDVENDFLGSAAVRQPDTDRFRLWEVAGTAHFDKTLLTRADAYQSCGSINDGPMHVVALTGMHVLKAWIANGNYAPEKAVRFDLTAAAKPTISRDVDGIALGGIRTPPVDVPVATISGVPGPTESTICQILGSTMPFTDARLAQLYPSASDYERRYDASTDAVIKAGFVLPEDRALLKMYEDPSRIPS
jgi:hypothetical protein